MSPQDQLALTEPQAQTSADRYLNGVTDAALNSSPTSTDPAYLDGYLSRLRALIIEGHYTLVIRWLSPAYISGNYDSPEDWHWEEF
jgi:hypothetical protein